MITKRTWIVSLIYIAIMVGLLLIQQGYAAMSFDGMEPDITWEENTEQYGDYLYTVKIKTTCTVLVTKDDTTLTFEDVCNVKYYHFIGKTEKTQILVDICDYMPSQRDLNLNMGYYLVMVEEEGI